MSLPPASFDGVLANAVLFHVPSRALPAVLDQLHTALKPGGVLLVSNPRGQDEEGFVDGRYACFYSFATWRRLVSRSGFALVDHYFRPPGKPRRINAALAEGATGGANLGATPATGRKLVRTVVGLQETRDSAGFRPSSATGSANCEPGIAPCR